LDVRRFKVVCSDDVSRNDLSGKLGGGTMLTGRKVTGKRVAGTTVLACLFAGRLRIVHFNRRGGTQYGSLHG
jgi:hypothetical protein